MAKKEKEIPHIKQRQQKVSIMEKVTAKIQLKTEVSIDIWSPWI